MSIPARLQTTIYYYLGIETRREKTDCWLFCGTQTLHRPRNGVTDWSIAQPLTDHWLICGEIVNNKKSHASQPTANQAKQNLSNIKVLGYLTEGNCCKFPQGKRIQGNLTGFKESVIFSVVYVLFINRFKLLGFNWWINYLDSFVVPGQNKRVSSLLFFLLGLYALISRFRAETLQRKIRDFSQSTEKTKRVVLTLLSLLSVFQLCVIIHLHLRYNIPYQHMVLFRTSENN